MERPITNRDIKLVEKTKLPTKKTAVLDGVTG